MSWLCSRFKPSWFIQDATTYLSRLANVTFLPCHHLLTKTQKLHNTTEEITPPHSFRVKSLMIWSQTLTSSFWHISTNAVNMQISLPKWNKKSKPTQPQKKRKKKRKKKTTTRWKYLCSDLSEHVDRQHFSKLFWASVLRRLRNDEQEFKPPVNVPR